MRLLRVNRNYGLRLDGAARVGHEGAMQPELSTAASTVLAALMLGAFVLAWGGVKMLRGGERQKGVLMLICAVVLVGNVLIWTV